MTRQSIKRLLWVTIFGITMGYFEASVVVYLRALFYPDGFSFPLAKGSLDIILVELGREAMSIGMLIAVGVLAGRSFFERFGVFCFAFGVWDILYYAFLKLILNWPESLFTWDILFLIPVPWVGPVWAPVLCSLCFIVSCVLIVRAEDMKKPLRPSPFEWAIAILGGLIVILSFCEESLAIMRGGIPQSFAWHIFFLGMAFGVFAFAKTYKRSR
ncbi:hypothetical protein JW926_07510 [Candidatus Sumerlaeota bacterium]|nr:hypothetical protein [Candidatus Sumerlaeota bacterium]